MGWGSAIGGFFKVTGQVLSRFWGDQTRADAKLEDEAEHVKVELQKALDGGDTDGANYWRLRLLRLHNKADARRKR